MSTLVGTFLVSLSLACSGTSGIGASEKPVGFQVCQANGGEGSECGIVRSSGKVNVRLHERAVQSGEWTATVRSTGGKVVWQGRMPANNADSNHIVVDCKP